ncbi:MAG: hypothetical protein Q9219_002678 [cf. Caloplaca sp. 3 TL-2023]
MDVMETSNKIIDIVFEYALNKFNDSTERLAAGRPEFLSVIQQFVNKGTQVVMCLPAFPFKSANKTEKVFGILPDKAEELALERLNTMCIRIGDVYSPGAKLTIISDGLVYNDLLGISDRDTWAYGEALRKLSARKGFKRIDFSRLRDLVDFPLPEKIEEIIYVANATNFRRFLFNKYGKEDIDIDHEIATNPDTQLTYLGYRRFLESDLKYIFPLGKDRSNHSYKRDVKYLAKQMLIRGFAFAGAVKHAFPHHLRLSIHESTGEHKVSMSLLNTKTGYTTPWHCSVALMEDGEWISSTMADFNEDPTLEIVYEDERPSYFRAKVLRPQEPAKGETAKAKRRALRRLNGQPTRSMSNPEIVAEKHVEVVEENTDQQSSTAASSLPSESEEAKVTELARTLSHHGVKDEKGELVNPFLASEHPLLDPHSDKFSAKAWLETLMSITSRDAERYPKRVAGVAYKNLSAHGFGEPTDYQKTFGNYPFKLLSLARRLFGKAKKTRIQILRDFEGLVKSGEMLVVLGRPGSGCSTLLKTISGETAGFHVAEDSYINYQGVPRAVMHKDFRGECIYQAEVDVHFPQLTVGQTLDFAARARAPHNRLPGVSRDVGNDFIRGVSGGERKRVSIAEAAIAGSPLQCWDNSTRGLDSATALEFVRTLRTSTAVTGATAIVALYQASQSIYDVFDKVTVLYEGRQIYFGNIHAAKTFFLDLGFECPPRQTTADFLTSLTNPAERVVRKGFEGKIPCTPDDFAAVWQNSEDRVRLLQQITEFDTQYPIGGPSLDEFKHSRKAFQARSQYVAAVVPPRVQSPYTLSVPMQVKLCVRRGYQRLRGDMALLITGILFNSVMALVIGSVFYNLPNDTESLYFRGALLFFAILLAAFASALEILTLYAQRPIVEKHSKYAFYHPFAEAIASMICDLPNKILTAIGFNLALYFMTNLRRTLSHFLVFLLFSFTCTLTMSMYFRSIAALSRTFPQAMAPASIFSLALVIYTGFTIPTKDMKPWFRWINHINPVGYAFESLMINEFHDRRIPCTEYVPRGSGYDTVSPDEKICATTGAAAGADFVDGDAYLAVNFHYHSDHLWRNLGFMIALMIFGCFVYLVATEYISAKKSKGEVLLFRRGRVPYAQQRYDEEADSDDRIENETIAREKTVPDAPATIQKQTSIVHWDSVNYDIKIKGKPRRILDEVDGWVIPGTLTALMGVTGAGKTTLLDVLANRLTMGVVSGEILVDGRLRDTGFQRKTGYVQQQDLHLATSTVREALTFSAVLRQPEATPHAEKVAYVEEVIKVLEMEAYADAVVGVPGEGLNVEQRKRLTIGVELAAKPALLLFLDEPTSGLDSQTAWSICALLRKLADNGQAILCTIHQPSAILFQEFDRLLFLAMGGQTLYFGDIGDSSKTLTNYFERHGARPCGKDENPAEWMLEVTGAAAGSEKSSQDWPALWHDSEERGAVKAELMRMKEAMAQKPVSVDDPDAIRPFAAPFATQLRIVLVRVFQQYWRTPSYLYSKVALCLFSALFISFSFYKTPNSLQGLQNQLYAVFMLLTIFSNFCQQIMPHFVTQRALYEARERPAKTYAWQVFILSNILVEVPWNALMAVLVFVGWYYPLGLRDNAVQADQVGERGILMFLFVLFFMVFAGTFTDMVIAGVETAEAAGNLVNLLFSMSLVFCGVLATPSLLPRFWIFMYRVSPFTYLVSGLLSTGLANAPLVCAADELLRFAPPAGVSCSDYLAPYIEEFGGYLAGGAAAGNITGDIADGAVAGAARASGGGETVGGRECVFCTLSDTNAFLRGVSVEWGDRWRNLGILGVYVVVNVGAAVGLYWLARVPRVPKGRREG